MKAGILTFHMAHNYGAMLQAYALSKKVNDFGIFAEIIDYRLPFINKYHYKMMSKETFEKNGFFLGLTKLLYRYLKGYYSDKKWNKFYHFMTKKLPISSKFDVDDLPELDYDVYICGSDQIWNGNLTGGLQGTYFCDFADKNCIKIAYAASSGTDDIIGDNVEDYLKNFDAIGVREYALAQTIEKKYNLRAAHVLDPVFLLTKDEWQNALCKNVKYKNYLLIYAFDESDYIYEVARKIAEEKNLKIVAVSYGKKDLGEDIIQLTGAGPEEFVSLFYNADFVCTTSFHGTAFSIIFNKQFLCFPHKQYRERTDSMLDMFELLDRNVEGAIDTSELLRIDYDMVNTLLDSKRQESLKFLTESIGV